jgi:hypothetical protein
MPGGDAALSSPRMHAQVQVRRQSCACGRTSSPSLPITQAHVALSFEGGDTATLIAMSILCLGTGDAVTSSMRVGGGGGRGIGASMTAARTTKMGRSWTAKQQCGQQQGGHPLKVQGLMGEEAKEEGRRASVREDVRQGESDPRTKDGGDQQGGRRQQGKHAT